MYSSFFEWSDSISSSEKIIIAFPLKSLAIYRTKRQLLTKYKLSYFPKGQGTNFKKHKNGLTKQNEIIYKKDNIS